MAKSKERLEEIHEMVDGMVFYKHLFQEDADRFYWLLEYAKDQTERLQELESDYVILGVEQEEKIMIELENLRKQNKRYREALGEISTTELPGIPIEKHINLLRKIADEALDES